MTACTADDASNIAANGAQYIGDSLRDLPENYQAAKPYLKEDLQNIWNKVAGGIEVCAEPLGISEPPHELAQAEEARELLISGASFDEVVNKATSELTTQDLEQVPSSDLSVLNGILPFDIDLTTCGENLAEVLNNLDIGQVSAVLQSEAGYHLIQLIDRDGAQVKIGHIIFQVDPTVAEQETPPTDQVAEATNPLTEAVERLAEALKNR
jgi:hypothetical protein